MPDDVPTDDALNGEERPEDDGVAGDDAGPVRRRMHERFLEEADHPDHQPMLPVLALTVGAVVIAPMLSEWRFGRTIAVVLVGGSALIALERSGAHRFVRRTSMTIVVFAAVLVALSPAIEDSSLADVIDPIATLLFAMVLAVTPIVVIGRLFMRPKITLDTVSASLAGYLQIGLMFSLLYNFVSLVQSEPFFAETTTADPFDFQYFSFITLTTVGYGDFTAATNAGKSLAMTEAVIGQVFLVTIVAVVVGNIGRELPHRRWAREGSVGRDPDSTGSS